MNRQEKENEMIGSLVELEEAVGNLYKIYAEKFPEYRDFWFSLWADEMEHAHTVSVLHTKVKEGLVSFKEDRFDTNLLKNSRHYVELQINKAKRGKISLTNALTIALTIENSIIESQFYEAFQGKRPELEEGISNLGSATKEHRDKIKKLLL